MATARSPYTVGLPRAVDCPFCGSDETTPLATFGSLLMTSQYYCRSCKTTFEWVRREQEPRQPRAH